VDIQFVEHWNYHRVKYTGLRTLPANLEMTVESFRILGCDNGDVQRWLNSFGPDQDWTTEELQEELQFCFIELDEMPERPWTSSRSSRSRPIIHSGSVKT
jgi:hypothetical protein